MLTVSQMEEAISHFGLNPKGGAINKDGKAQCIVLNLNARRVEKANTV